MTISLQRRLRNILQLSCFPNKFRILLLRTREKTDVKNKQPAIFATARLSQLFNSCLSVAISPFFILLCDVGDGILPMTFCLARGFWKETRTPEQERCCPSHVTQLCFTLSLQFFFSTQRPASSLPASDTPAPGQLASLLWTELCLLKIHVDALTPV